MKIRATPTAPRSASSDSDQPVPRKSDPGARTRQVFTSDDAKAFVANVAKEAARLKKNTPTGEKEEAFLPLQRSSGLTRETLLRWARLYERVGNRLAGYLVELGPTKLLVVNGCPEPELVLKAGITKTEGSNEVIDVREISAEQLRLTIRDRYPTRRRGNWFRKHGDRTLSKSLRNTLKWLVEDLSRIGHSLGSGSPLTVKEHVALQAFARDLTRMATSISTKIVAKVNADEALKRKQRFPSRRSR